MSTAATSSAAEEYADRRHSPLERVQHLLHGKPWISPLVILLLAVLVFTLINPRFVERGPISLLIQQTAVTAALAIGQTLIILTAGIDLAVGAITVLSMMVMASLAANNGVPGPFALIIGVVLGLLAGAINGLLVTRVNLPPFIVTLGTLNVFTAIALLYSGSESIQDNRMPGLLNAMGQNAIQIGPTGNSLTLTWGVVVVILMYAVVGFALSQTAWGRHLYAVGDDPEAARLAGVDSKRVLLSVYTVAGLLYGLAGWILIGRAGAATPNAMPQANLESITAVVIGGTSLFGGRGGLIGSLLGALIVQAFSFGLSLAGVDQQWRLLAIGLLIIFAVAVDQWIRRVKA